jgi:hypothetical protein
VLHGVSADLYHGIRGTQPGGANANPKNSKAGDTVQPTKVQVPLLRDVCQASGGTMICGL